MTGNTEAAELSRVADRVKVAGVGLVGIGRTAGSLEELRRDVRGQLAALEAILWPLEQGR